MAWKSLDSYTFPPISAWATRSGKCPVCGKSARRDKTFVHTVNPFNRNSDGMIKDANEVYRDVRAEAAAWVPDFTHTKCRKS